MLGDETCVGSACGCSGQLSLFLTILEAAADAAARGGLATVLLARSYQGRKCQVMIHSAALHTTATVLIKLTLASDQDFNR